MDNIEAFAGAALQGGFSVAVSAFLLLRMERGLREAISLLRHCQTCRLSPLEGSRSGSGEARG